MINLYELYISRKINEPTLAQTHPKRNLVVWGPFELLVAFMNQPDFSSP